MRYQRLITGTETSIDAGVATLTGDFWEPSPELLRMLYDLKVALSAEKDLVQLTLRFTR